MQVHFTEDMFLKRNRQPVDDQCASLRQADTVGMRDRLSRAYGINRRSAAMDFPHFDITQMVPGDIMHILVEGVAVYEVKAALSRLVENETFSMKGLNHQLENLLCGYKDGEN